MMGNEIESYLCMLSYTDYMRDLLLNNKKDIKELPDVVEAVEIMQDFEQFNNIDMRDLLFEPKNLEKHRDIIEILGHDEKFKSIEQIKKINNIHIQNAIKELEKPK